MWDALPVWTCELETCSIFVYHHVIMTEANLLEPVQPLTMIGARANARRIASKLGRLLATFPLSTVQAFGDLEHHLLTAKHGTLANGFLEDLRFTK